MVSSKMCVCVCFLKAKTTFSNDILGAVSMLLVCLPSERIDRQIYGMFAIPKAGEDEVH